MHIEERKGHYKKLGILYAKKVEVFSKFSSLS